MKGKAVSRLKVVICYPLVNAYMAACWRELAQSSSVDLFVVGFQAGSKDMVAFNSDIMDGVPSRLLVESERSDPRLVEEIVTALKPDVLLISGWSEPAYRPLYFSRPLGKVPKVLMMDNQLRRDFRQWIGSAALKPLLKRVDRIFVTGERSWQFARYLGFDEGRIHRGVVSVDYRSLSPIYHDRVAKTDGWPKSFFFAGRYHKRKAIDVMIDAYRDYRSRHAHPWPLVTAGMGPEAALLNGVDGIVDLGFVHPNMMGQRWLEAGVFVIPSRFDAWPLVIVEAAATGLPIIATEACGSTVENVRHLFNGRLVPSNDVGRLSLELSWMHNHYNLLPIYGARSSQLAAAYGSDVWAARVEELVELLATSER